MSTVTRPVVPFGDAAVLATDLPRAEVHPLAAGVRGAERRGVRDVVEGLRSVLVTLDADVLGVEEAADWIAGLDPVPAGAVPSRSVVVPATFGGPDVDEVCSSAGITPDELVRLLTGADLTVAVVGFSPGFAYLEGLPEPLDAVARRARPRPAVPAGSVALAAGFAAVYPQATPGGWQLVGRTSMPLFDPAAPPYAVLAPGDRVRFRAVASSHDPGVAPPRDRAPLRVRAGRRAGLVVERAGVPSLVEDGGRAGVAHLGVPGAGPADPVAHELANRLVGNAPGAAALEVTAHGPTLRALVDLFVAVVGGEPQVLVDGRDVGHSHVVPVRAGQAISVGSFSRGLRAYLAAAGGLDVPPVLGSRSTDVLTRLGPGPLSAGDEVGIGDAGVGPMADHLVARDPAPRGSRAAPSAWELRVLPGPQAGWLAHGVDELAARRFAVGATSDRVGVRLEPDVPPVPRRAAELPSQGTVTGAVQLPPDGRPIVLGPDHATLGGYPVVAVVISADRWMLGQCRPGDAVTFVPVGLAAAGTALGDQRRRLAGCVVGRYPLGGAGG